MYAPGFNRLPSAIAAVLVAAVTIFMTVAPAAENRVSARDPQVAATENAPLGVCVEHAFVACEPIRA